MGVTCASAANPLLAALGGCAVLILDEASQMTEPLSLLPLAAGRPLRLLVVGDPKQLPPTVAGTAPAPDPPAAAPGTTTTTTAAAPPAAASIPPLARTLFDRLVLLGHHPTRLSVQVGVAAAFSPWPLPPPGRSLCPPPTPTHPLTLVPTPLSAQYRCHPAIADVCSQLFYGGTLQHGVTAGDRPPLVPCLPPIVALDCRGQVCRALHTHLFQ